MLCGNLNSKRNPSIRMLRLTVTGGGTCKDRKSTSGGVWMVGKHCVKTWSASQGPFALSSAEAGFYELLRQSLEQKDSLVLH